jgi:hypothetical protein
LETLKARGAIQKPHLAVVIALPKRLPLVFTLANALLGSRENALDAEQKLTIWQVFEGLSA